MPRFALALLAAVVLATLPALPAPVPKRKPAELYLPANAGAVKVMTVRDTKSGRSICERREEVKEVSTKDGTRRVTVEEREDGRWVADSVYETTERGVWAAAPAEPKGAAAQLLLPLDRKAGERWEGKPVLPDGRVSVHFTYTLGGEEEVEVPAGKFNAILVSREYEQLGTTRTQMAWHAAGVGVVKRAFATDGVADPFVWEMKAFTPGKDECPPGTPPDARQNRTQPRIRLRTEGAAGWCRRLCRARRQWNSAPRSGTIVPPASAGPRYLPAPVVYPRRPAARDSPARRGPPPRPSRAEPCTPPCSPWPSPRRSPPRP